MAFGNVNTGTGLGKKTWSKDGYSNELNKYNNKGYLGCTFGLVTGMSDGKIVYASGINAPKLFNEKGTVTGKTSYNDYTLKFRRAGNSYSLMAVNGTVATNLENFSHPTNSGGTYTNIWTNNFWPMDSAPSFGTNGHDVKFGATANYKNKTHQLKFGPITEKGTDYNFPESDDGKHHNSYFGMRCEIEFDVHKDYIGPLEWYFFGDDDLWGFLDGQLILDIGGVHTSTGEYVNLRDYLPNGSSGKHKITFFYTERGGSGSTCYMNFSLPIIEEESDDRPLGALRINKEVIGSDTKENFNFLVTLKDENNQELSEYYYCNKHTSDGKITAALAKSGGVVTFNKDEYVTIEGIPAGTTYSVEEIENDEFITKTQDTNGKIEQNKVATATITNTYNVKTAKVIKKWKDNIDTEKPENVQVKLVPKVGGNEIDENDPDFQFISLYVKLTEANNWSYTWNNLPKYKIINDESGENIVEIEYTIQEIFEKELENQYYFEASSVNEEGEIVLTNILYRSIEITKIAAQDKDLKLGGAEFKLEKLKKDGLQWVVDESFAPRTGITSSEEEDLGKFTFTQLEYGRYRLTEEKAPIGYNPSKKSIDIEIDEKTELIVQKEIKNKLAEPLPFTGGSGINIYATAGCLLVLYVFSNIRRQRAALNRKLKPKRRKKSRKPMR